MTACMHAHDARGNVWNDESFALLLDILPMRQTQKEGNVNLLRRFCAEP
jgi:hypothetical protein